MCCFPVNLKYLLTQEWIETVDNAYEVAVPVLLEANAEVNVVNGWNRSPLWNAAYKNHREAVIALCAAGADPHLGDPSPLRDSIEEMKTLIREQLSL